jgi:hypothetical protein
VILAFKKGTSHKGTSHKGIKAIISEKRRENKVKT